MITSLSLPPLNYFILNFFTFTLFFLFLTKKSEKHKNLFLFFLYGWLFGFGYFATNLYWISISLTFDPNFKFLIPFTFFFIPAFLAIFYGLVTCFFRRFRVTTANNKWIDVGARDLYVEDGGERNFLASA